MSTKFMVEGQEKELSYNWNGVDISADFIGNRDHGMGSDAEGRYIATQEDFDWWQNTIAAHKSMNKTIEAYKAIFDPDKVDRIVQDYIDVDIDYQPTHVTMGLEKIFGIIKL